MNDDHKKIELIPGDLEFKDSPNMPDKQNIQLPCDHNLRIVHFVWLVVR